MRWSNDSQFVEISLGLTTDHAEVWSVDTNVDWTTLPVEFRQMPERTDAEALAKLRRAVESWTARNGFQPA